MTDTVSHLVSSYGYIIVGLFVGLESAGLPIPGETALLTAGAYSSTGQLSIKIVILVAAFSAVIGDAAGYWMGRKMGRRLIAKYGGRFWLNEEKLKRIEAFFQRHGPKTVFFGRFIGILRTYSAFFAGVSKMQYGRFTIFNAAGGILWATLFGSLGYEFGKQLPLIERIARAIGWGTLIIILVLIAGVFLWRMLERHEKGVSHLGNAIGNSLPISRLRQRFRGPVAWLRRRLQPAQYLGLHFTLGLLSSAACLWLFSDLAEDVVTRDPIIQFDLSVAEKIRSLSSPVAMGIMVFITTLGNFVLIGICLTGIVIYRWRRQPYLIGGWLITLIGGEMLNILLKQWIHRTRPEMVIILARGYSFPSGHAMLSLIAYGLFTYLLCLEKRSWKTRTALVCACAMLVLLIGFSRIYLGVHYFSDVIAGFAAGGLWLSTCITAIELVRKKRIKGAAQIMQPLPEG